MPCHVESLALRTGKLSKSFLGSSRPSRCHNLCGGDGRVDHRPVKKTVLRSRGPVRLHVSPDPRSRCLRSERNARQKFLSASTKSAKSSSGREGGSWVTMLGGRVAIMSNWTPRVSPPHPGWSVLVRVMRVQHASLKKPSTTDFSLG